MLRRSPGASSAQGFGVQASRAKACGQAAGAGASPEGPDGGRRRQDYQSEQGDGTTGGAVHRSAATAGASDGTGTRAQARTDRRPVWDGGKGQEGTLPEGALVQPVQEGSLGSPTVTAGRF